MIRVWKFVVIVALYWIALSYGSTIRGVAPDEVDRYSHPCLDGSLNIDKSEINDDFCDCTDGSDERGTSACPNSKFFCRNKGWKSKIIHSSFVNDGLCDCCDGSDEFDSRKECPNTCSAEKAKTSKHTRTMLQDVKKALESRDSLMSDAIVTKTEKQNKLEKLKKELEAEKVRLAEFEAKRTDLETEEEKQRAVRVAEAEIEAERLREELKTAETEAKTEKETEGQTGDGRPGTESVDEGNSQPEMEPAEITDAGKDEEPEKFPFPDQYAYHGELKDSDFEDEEDDEDDEDEEVEGDYLKKTEPAEGDDETAIDPEQVVRDAEDFKLPDAEDVREEVRKQEGTISRIEREINELEDFLKTDFGKDDIVMSIVDECFDITSSKYTYEFCAFGKAAQKDGGSSTSLGQFEGWKRENDKELMQFTGGQKCWNGPNRALDVEFLCGPINHIFRVDEPSTCKYTMVFQTPTMCSPETVKKLQDELHDEL
eukprot:231463_1